MTEDIFSEKYMLDHLEKKIKHEISMYIYVNHDRHPTKEEYEEYFEKWKSKLECKITVFDLGIFE